MTDIKIIEEFVKNSNCIERIFEEHGNILYDNHLNTALKIEEESIKYNKVLHPLHIHAFLMKNILKYPGIYRSVEIYITNTSKSNQPLRSNLVEKAMNKWYESLKNDLETLYTLKNQNQLKEELVENIAWNYHHWFESIHPFIDGNGRTGRLLLNNIRRCFGLPWLIIKGTPKDSEELIKEHIDYYKSITKWRKNNYKLLFL